MVPLRGLPERSGRPPRGQPVIALAMILTMWIAVRMTFIALEGGHEPVGLVRAGPPHGRLDAASIPAQASGVAPVARTIKGEAAAQAVPPPAMPTTHRPWPETARTHGPRLLARLPTAAAGQEDMTSTAQTGQDLETPVWMVPSRTAYLTTDEAPARLSQPGAGPPPLAFAPRRGSRWSADGWVLARGGDPAPSLAAGARSYGGSQAGAVLRYGLVPGSSLRPQAYVRVSSALGRVRQNEAALGLMARPLRGVPLAMLGEVRLQDQGGAGQTVPLRVRPVVMAVTELPPLPLPLSFEAEAYGEAGWAGGRDATAFYDLAATVQRRVIPPVGGIALSAGGGVWSGGQRGAARLDLGPRVEIRGMVGPPARRIGVRVGVDWRFRVAGKAEPGSGPALTVAAGF